MLYLWIYCQNSNLTTNQPNLNLRLDLTWLLLVTPTPPPTSNSTSTRNIGPRDLKFCMQPHLTKLTTIQLNFNPTIFGRGGSYILPLGLTLPDWFFLEKNIFWQKSSWPKFFLTQNFFKQNFFDTKFFLTQIFLTQIFLT